MKYTQKVKVVNQGSKVMTIPKVMAQLMKLEFGDILSVEFDFENLCMIVRKDTDERI